MVQYANNIQIILSGKNSLPQPIATRKQALKSWGTRFNAHVLKVNTGKTELILFRFCQSFRGLDPISIRFDEDMIRGATQRGPLA